MEQRRYLAPDQLTRRVVNPAMAAMTRVGLSLRGSRLLRVRGRQSGEWRTTVVNPVGVGGDRYLVAPRGETLWVRNLRVAGSGELRLGRRTEAFHAHEIDDDAKPPILRQYLTTWKSEVGQFFDGIGPDSPDADLQAIAAGYPVFRITAEP